MGELYLDNIERLWAKEPHEKPASTEKPDTTKSVKRPTPVYTFESPIECPGLSWYR